MVLQKIPATLMLPVLSIDIVTLFPKMAEGYFEESVLGKAVRKGILDVRVHNLRDWATGKHAQADDRPFGGGPGMVLKPEPLAACIESLRKDLSKVIYLCPDGIPLRPSVAKRLAKESHLIFISGHYEGIDERIREQFVDEEISIGDYVLTNGTLAAVVLLDAIGRHVPGVLGDQESVAADSFENQLLSFPQYTRPSNFSGMSVPDVLLSGDHASIAQWRKEQQIAKTRARRPDLFQSLLTAII